METSYKHELVGKKKNRYHKLGAINKMGFDKIFKRGE